MNKFSCYKPYNSKFDVTYYVCDCDGYWTGNNKYGEFVRNKLSLGQYITDGQIIQWIREGKGELVDAPVYEKRWEPKLVMQAWHGKVWYTLFDEETKSKQYYAVGERHTGGAPFKNYDEFIYNCERALEGWTLANYFYRIVEGNDKQVLMDMVRKHGS